MSRLRLNSKKGTIWMGMYILYMLEAVAKKCGSIMLVQ